MKNNKEEGRLIMGLKKVISRQNEKASKVIVNGVTYESKKFTLMWEHTSNFYYPLLWQPLKYIIKKVAHTTYTYEVSKLPMAKSISNRLRRKSTERKRKNQK